MDCRAGAPRGAVVLRFGFNALAAFEAESKRPAFHAIAELESGDLAMASDLRLLCWAAMLHHQPQATIKAAGHLLDADPSCVHRALQIALPMAGDVEPDTAKKRTAVLRTCATFFGRGWKRIFRSAASGM